MTRIPFPATAQTVAFAGDWHGKSHYGRDAIQHASAADVILHVGDFGGHFEERYLDAINDAAETADLIFMFADGNHEDFDWLLSQPVDDDGVRRLRPRVWHLPRGFRWDWAGVTFLSMGGAPSVDRPARVPGRDWWSQEAITLREAMEVAAGDPVDVMLCHDCPDGVLIPGLERTAGLFRPEELTSSEQHREVLGGIVRALRPAFLWHGHYHVRYEGVLKYDDGALCLVNGLDRDGRPLDWNVHVVSVSEMGGRKEEGAA